MVSTRTGTGTGTSASEANLNRSCSTTYANETNQNMKRKRKIREIVPLSNWSCRTLTFGYPMPGAGSMVNVTECPLLVIVSISGGQS